MSAGGRAAAGEWVGEHPNQKFVFSIENMYVYVYEASITDITDVDSIINATNDKLATGAGVAAVIAGKAGRQMVNACNDYVRDNGALHVSENFISTAGNLPFKGIIHAVGPTWNNYHGRQIECAEDLFNTVFNALTAARDRRWTSVALPAISSGKSGVPKKLCAEMYMKAFADFAENGHGCIREVHFVDMNSEMIDLVCEAQEKWYNNPQSLSFANASKYRGPSQQARSDFSASTDNVPGNIAIPKDNSKSKRPDDERGMAQPSARRPDTFTGFGEDARYRFKAENLRVYVYQCSITQISGMDALTNSTIENLEHRCGVALEISNAAGEEMVADCTEYVQTHGNVKNTRNYISIPGRLHCRGIVHTVGPHWDRYSGHREECARDLYYTVINALVSVKQRNWRKVAMPAISSEHSGVPKQLCAEMYVKAITEFAERGSGSVTEVHFVDIDKKMLEMVVKAHKHWVRDPNSLCFENANSY